MPHPPCSEPNQSGKPQRAKTQYCDGEISARIHVPAQTVHGKCFDMTKIAGEPKKCRYAVEMDVLEAFIPSKQEIRVWTGARRPSKTRGMKGSSRVLE